MNESIIIEALGKFLAQHEKCRFELAKEINIGELKLKQLNTLQLIHQNAPVSYSRLAQILRITRPSATSLVNQLMRTGAVDRRQCTRDGRIFYIELSEQGKKIIAFKKLEHKRLAVIISRALTTDEMILFVQLIQKIAES